jgi:hypothetical protein
LLKIVPLIFCFISGNFKVKYRTMPYNPEFPTSTSGLDTLSRISGGAGISPVVAQAQACG